MQRKATVHVNVENRIHARLPPLTGFREEKSSQGVPFVANLLIMKNAGAHSVSWELFILPPFQAVLLHVYVMKEVAQLICIFSARWILWPEARASLYNL